MTVGVRVPGNTGVHVSVVTCRCCCAADRTRTVVRRRAPRAGRGLGDRVTAQVAVHPLSRGEHRDQLVRRGPRVGQARRQPEQRRGEARSPVGHCHHSAISSIGAPPRRGRRPPPRGRPARPGASTGVKSTTAVAPNPRTARCRTDRRARSDSVPSPVAAAAASRGTARPMSVSEPALGVGDLAPGEPVGPAVQIGTLAQEARLRDVDEGLVQADRPAGPRRGAARTRRRTGARSIRTPPSGRRRTGSVGRSHPGNRSLLERRQPRRLAGSTTGLDHRLPHRQVRPRPPATVPARPRSR